MFSDIIEKANNDDNIEQISLSISMEVIEGILGVSTKP